MLYILYESASGYALFERVESEEIADESPELQKSIQDFGRFSRLVKFKSFVPFASAESALENVNAVSEGAHSLSPAPYHVSARRAGESDGTTNPRFGFPSHTQDWCTMSSSTSLN